MKKFRTFLLSILLVSALTACGTYGRQNVEAGGSAEKTEQSENPPSLQEESQPATEEEPSIEKEEPQPGTAETQQEKQDRAWAAAYNELVERFRTLVSDPDSSDSDEPGEMGVLETARTLGADAVYQMGYLIEDLSGDGIPELAVGQLDGPIIALYTLADGKPQLVFAGWYRNMYVYMGDGHFYYCGSGSAVESGAGIFYLSKDARELKCESFLFTSRDKNGDICVYSNENGSWEPERSEKSEMSLEEFWALDPAGAPMPLIPFSGEGGQSTSGAAAPVSVDYLTAVGDEEYNWVTLYDGQEACAIVFTTDSTVTDFTLWNLFAEDITENGDLIFSADAIDVDDSEGLNSLPSVMTPDTRIAVQLIFPGDTPSYGISYVDAAGKLRRFVIEMSGYDGSLLLLETDPEDNRFVLRSGN